MLPGKWWNCSDQANQVFSWSVDIFQPLEQCVVYSAHSTHWSLSERFTALICYSEHQEGWCLGGTILGCEHWHEAINRRCGMVWRAVNIHMVWDVLFFLKILWWNFHWRQEHKASIQKVLERERYLLGGIWFHTQQFLKKKLFGEVIVSHFFIWCDE